MISSSIPVSFLYCCLFSLPCSDNLLLVRERDIAQGLEGGRIIQWGG